MLGDSIADAYRTVQHDAFDEDGLVSLGRTHFGHATVVNRAYLDLAPHHTLGFGQRMKRFVSSDVSSLVVEKHRRPRIS